MGAVSFLFSLPRLPYLSDRGTKPVPSTEKCLRLQALSHGLWRGRGKGSPIAWHATHDLLDGVSSSVTQREVVALRTPLDGSTNIFQYTTGAPPILNSCANTPLVYLELFLQFTSGPVSPLPVFRGRKMLALTNSECA